MQTASTLDPQPANAGIRWLKLAVVYLLIGVGMGIAMGASENYTLRPVHAHINLLGWVTLALAGLTYSAFPKAAATRLASAHFWLHNLSLPVMMAALAALLYGYPQVLPLLGASEIAMAAGLIAFSLNIFLNLSSVAAGKAPVDGRGQRHASGVVPGPTALQADAPD